MIKAVFIDYTGTIVEKDGKELKDVVMRLCKNSHIHEPKDVMELWWKLIRKYEEDSYGGHYLTEDEIVHEALKDMVKQINLNDDLEELHGLVQSFWINAPLFSDAKIFFENCPLPIYIISNISIEYIEKSIKNKKIFPKGIVCADMAHAYKPHKELFEKALEISGYSSDEVIHIGDSYGSDVQGALSSGIKPILIDRSGDKKYEDIIIIQDLTEVLNLL